MIRVNGQVIGTHKFPDGTARFTKKEFEAFKMFGNEIVWNYEHDGELIILMFLKKYMDDNACLDVTLTIPYLPNARMDRVKDATDVFTLKYFANFINSLQFIGVTVLDPHSAVSCALIDNLFIVPAQDYIYHAVIDLTERRNMSNVVLFYPDEGAMKRYSGMIQAPYIFGVKNRDWETGEIKSLDVIGDKNLIEGRNILIVDDICSRGGTFYHSAKKLKELGAEHVFLYVTHCEDTIHKGELLKTDLIEHIYTTNSLLRKPDPKITIFDTEAN